MDNRFIAADLRLARPTQVRVVKDGDSFKIKVNVTLEGGLVGSQVDRDYTNPKTFETVSYTHLDVYKRQVLYW